MGESIVVQIVVDSKGRIVGLDNDGNLWVMNDSTKKWTKYS